MLGRGRVEEALQSEWGRLFAQWEHLEPDEEGYKGVSSAEGLSLPR